MLPCSSIQRLERVAGTLSSGNSNNNASASSSSSNQQQLQLQNASTFVWTSLKDQDQLNVITLCDSSLWETSTEFLIKRPQNPISESLALAMSRSVQLLVGLRQLGDDEVLRRAEEAAAKARKKFAGNNNNNNNGNNNTFVIEAKFEPFVSRCGKICSCLCQLVGNRRFRNVILRAVERDVSSASVITDMFLATSELLFDENKKNNTNLSLHKILSQQHRILFSMILFLASVREKNSHTIATLGLMFHRSSVIGAHVENNFNNNNQSQNQQKESKNNNAGSAKQNHGVATPKISVIETILDLPDNSGQELLAALLRPILDTHGARAAVYYDFNIAALTKNKVNQGEFTSFINLLDGTHTKFFPPQKQLEFLASVYLAFVSCENADEYFQEKKKALIRSELKAAFSNRNIASTGLSSLVNSNSNNNKRESSVSTTTTSSGFNNNNSISSANIRVSLMNHVLVKMTKILHHSYDFAAHLSSSSSSSSASVPPSSASLSPSENSSTTQTAAATKIFENLTELDKRNIAKSWWFSVQQLFEGLQRSRALVASDDLRYNNGFGFESIFKLVKILLLDTLDIIISNNHNDDKSASPNGTNNRQKTLSATMSSLFSSSTASLLLFNNNNNNNNNDDDETNSQNGFGINVCKDVATISQLESTLKAIAPSFLLLLNSEGNNNTKKKSSSSSSESTTNVLSAICKCLTCIGRLAPTHLMRFLPTVVRSLTRVKKTNNNNNEQILEFLCFSINHLGKLNQASSFLKSLLKEILNLNNNNNNNNEQSNVSSLLLFDILQQQNILNAVRNAAAESLDAETILSVSTEIAEAAIEHGISSSSSSSSERKNVHVLFKIARAIIDGIGANPVSGLTVTEQLVAADATMSFAISVAVKEVLENEDNDNNNAQDDDEAESTQKQQQDLAGLFDALDFVTSCRKKLFVVLQNAGVPSIDQLLISLNKTTWHFPAQIPLLLGSEGVSPTLKQLLKILKMHASSFSTSSSSQSESEIFIVCKYFTSLASSQLRLASIVSQLVGSDDETNKKGDADDETEFSSAFDIVCDAGAQSLAKNISKQLVKFCYHFLEEQKQISSDNNNKIDNTATVLSHILVSKFNIDKSDLFLLRQLDAEGSESLISYLLSSNGARNEKLFTSFAASGTSIAEGTADVWRNERGPNVNNNNNNGKKNATNNKTSTAKQNKKGGNDDDDSDDDEKTSKNNANSTNSLVENSSSFVAAIFDIFKNHKQLASSIKNNDNDDDDNEEENQDKAVTENDLFNRVVKAIKEITWNLTLRSHTPKSQQLRQNLLAALAITKNNSDDDAETTTASCFLKTLEFLIDSSKKPGASDSSLFALWGKAISIFSSSSLSTLFIDKLFPLIVRLSTTKIAFIVAKAVEQSATENNNNNNNEIIITIVVSILRQITSSGVSSANLVAESSGFLRSLHKLIEGMNLKLFSVFSSSSSTAATATHQSNANKFTLLVNDSLWLSKLSLQCFVALQSSARSHGTLITLLTNFEQQLLAYIVFLDRCLAVGSKTQSRLIIRRVCDALAILYGDVYEGTESSSAATLQHETSKKNTNSASQNQHHHHHLAVSSSSKRKQIQQILQLHASKFALAIISIVSAPWMFSITSCAETLLRLSAVSLSDETLASGGDGTLGSNRSLILKWLCQDSEASTTLHETAITMLVAASNSGGGEEAERMAKNNSKNKNQGGKISIRRTGGATVSSNTDANDFVFVALTNWPEAQLRLKSLHMEASERV